MRRILPLDGETVLIKENIHWREYLFPAAILAVSMILLLLRMKYPSTNLINILTGKNMLKIRLPAILLLTEALFLLGAASAAWVRITKMLYVRYYVTDKRIICMSGIMEVSYQEMLISRCEMVFLHQSPVESFFGSGDILCFSPGARIQLNDVRNAIRFKQTILTQMPQTNERNSQNG